MQLAGCLRRRNIERSLTASSRRRPYWLRHTAGSHMANNAIELRHVRDNFWHESNSTTGHYLQADDDASHRNTQARHKIRW